MENYSINTIRGFFASITTLLGMLVAMSLGEHPLWGVAGGFLFSALMIFVESALKYFTFRDFSHATIGLMVGLFCAWLILRVFEEPWFSSENATGQVEYWKSVIQMAIYLGLAFLGMMLAMRSNREEFSFIIPYVRFRQDSLQEQPLLLDTNIIIDGRVPRITESGFLSGALIVPRFVIDELHMLADSGDPIKRDRGKRGLECLNTMKQDPNVEINIKDDPLSADVDGGVDAKLVAMARRNGARIVTNDANLAGIGRLQGVRVLNFNELAHALRPIVAPGDHIELVLVKEGRDDHQAVGYLADGTMIVVNHGRDRIGNSEEVVVAGTLQTSAGRLIFAELEENWHGSSGPSLKHAVENDSSAHPGESPKT